jgi:hypothetical protein
LINLVFYEITGLEVHYHLGGEVWHVRNQDHRIRDGPGSATLMVLLEIGNLGLQVADVAN